jgi:hypothetical protein
MDSCGHCGYDGPLEHKGNVTAEQTEQFHDGIGSYAWAQIWSLSRCPQCGGPTLVSYGWSDEWSDPENTDVTRLYPSPQDDSSIPLRVRQQLTTTRRVKSIDPGFFALGVRRMLEAVCLEEAAEGDSLVEQLQVLADKDRLPQTLVEAATELRKFGNLGAHVSEVEVRPEDLPLLDDLADAILEYLYRAPAKVAHVQDELKRRQAAVSDDGPAPAGSD